MSRKKLERRGEGPVWRKTFKTWAGRVWLADGSHSGWQPLDTDDRGQAKKILDQWVETGEVPVNLRGKELFAKAAVRIVDEREADGSIEPELAKDRRTRLRLYAIPELGHLAVEAIKPSHVVGVMREMATKHGKSAGSILKLRSDISQILAELKSEGALDVNVAREIPVPKSARVDTRERVMLDDAQILKFQDERGYDTELDMMVVFTREIGGHRTSDEHAGVWEEVDLENFAWMKVRRPKTDGEVGAGTRFGKRKTRAYEMVTHETHERHRPILRAYWERMGKPTSGPIFPLLRDGVGTPMMMKDGRVVTRKPSKAGEHKGRGTSYAKALRRAVWEVGIYQPFTKAQLKGRRPFDPAHPDKSKCALQTDTETTRRLDFKSFRRGLNTALADAGVGTATMLGIMGHTQLSTELKHYLGKRTVKVPDAALPGGARAPEHPEHPEVTAEVLAAFEALRAALDPKATAAQAIKPRRGYNGASSDHTPSRKSAKPLASPKGFEPLTNALGMHRGSDHTSQSPGNSKAVRASRSPSTPIENRGAVGLEDRFAGLRAEAARAVVAGDWALADSIRAAIDGASKGRLDSAPAADPQLPPVASLDAARRKRRSK